MAPNGEGAPESTAAPNSGSNLLRITVECDHCWSSTRVVERISWNAPFPQQQKNRPIQPGSGSRLLTINRRPVQLLYKPGMFGVVDPTLTHRYNAVRSHRKGANNSGVQDCLRRTNRNRRIRTKTATNRIPQTKIKKGDNQHTYDTCTYVLDTYRVLNESQKKRNRGEETAQYPHENVQQ